MVSFFSNKTRKKFNLAKNLLERLLRLFVTRTKRYKKRFQKAGQELLQPFFQIFAEVNLLSIENGTEKIENENKKKTN